MGLSSCQVSQAKCLNILVAIFILDLLIIDQYRTLAQGSSFADSATQGLLGMLFAPFDNGDGNGQQKKGPNLSQLLGVQPQASGGNQKPAYQVNPGPQPNYGSLPSEQESPTRSGYPPNPWYNQNAYKHWAPPPEKPWAPPPEKPWTPAPTWAPQTWAPPASNASGSHATASWAHVHYDPKSYYPQQTHYHHHQPWKPKPNLNGYVHSSWKPPPPAHGPWKKPQYGVVDTHVRLPPIKFRFHLSPKITLASNTKDPLDKQKPGYQDEDFVYPPPTPYPQHQPPPKSHQHPYDVAHHHKGLYDPTFAVKIKPTVVEPKPHYGHYPHHQHHYGYAQPHYTSQHVHYQPWQPWQTQHQGTDRQGSPSNATRRSESGNLPLAVAAPSATNPVTTRPIPRSINFDSTPSSIDYTIISTTTTAPTTTTTTFAPTTTAPTTTTTFVPTTTTPTTTTTSAPTTTAPTTTTTSATTTTTTTTTTTLSTNANTPSSTTDATMATNPTTTTSNTREETTIPTTMVTVTTNVPMSSSSAVANVSENEIVQKKTNPEVPTTTASLDIERESLSRITMMNTTASP